MRDRLLEHAADGLLATRAAEGDAESFDVLVRRYSPLMRAYAARLLGGNADADDVVQEAFVTAWNRLDSLVEVDAVKSWLMRVVSRKAVDVMRSRRQESSWEDEELELTRSDHRSGPETQAVLRDEVDAVKRILGEMPERQRQSWFLYAVAGYSYQEIADELETPLSTVRGALSRARTALARGMEGRI